MPIRKNRYTKSRKNTNKIISNTNNTTSINLNFPAEWSVDSALCI